MTSFMKTKTCFTPLHLKANEARLIQMIHDFIPAARVAVAVVAGGEAVVGGGVAVAPIASPAAPVANVPPAHCPETAAALAALVAAEHEVENTQKEMDAAALAAVPPGFEDFELDGDDAQEAAALSAASAEIRDERPELERLGHRRRSVRFKKKPSRLDW